MIAECIAMNTIALASNCDLFIAVVVVVYMHHLLMTLLTTNTAINKHHSQHNKSNPACKIRS